MQVIIQDINCNTLKVQYYPYYHQQKSITGEENMGTSERQEFLDYSYRETCSERWEEACFNYYKMWQPNFFGADSGLDEMHGLLFLSLL